LTGRLIQRGGQRIVHASPCVRGLILRLILLRRLNLCDGETCNS
jgi:hypothetical protein